MGKPIPDIEKTDCTDRPIFYSYHIILTNTQKFRSDSDSGGRIKCILLGLDGAITLSENWIFFVIYFWIVYHV